MSNLATTLEQEIQTIDQQITVLNGRREAIGRLLSFEQPGYSGSRAPVKASKAAVKTKTKSKKTAGKKPRKNVQTITQTSSATRPGRKNALSGTEMAVRCLQNNNHNEMKMKEIRAAIKRDFGVEAPNSLDQMIYKAQRADRLFYKGDHGFGLLEWRGGRQQAAA